MNIIDFINNVLNCVEVIKYNKLDWYDLGLNRWYDPLYLNYLEKSLKDCEVNHPNKSYIAFSIKINSYTHDNFCYESFKTIKKTTAIKIAYIIIPIELENQINMLREIELNVFNLYDKPQCHCRKSFETYSVEYMDILSLPTEYILK